MIVAKVLIEPWSIQRESPMDDFSQSIFCIGNGFLGVRGFGGWELKQGQQQHGMYRAGLFEFIKPGITDMVQLPDILTLRVIGEKPSYVKQTLDMQHGMLTQSWESGNADIRLERAVSMADSQLIMQRLTITAKQTGMYAVESVADASVCNLPIHDDQMIMATDLVKLLHVESLSETCIGLRTVPSGHDVGLSWALDSDRRAESTVEVRKDVVTTMLILVLQAGETWSVGKCVRVLVKGEQPHSDEQDPWGAHKRAWVALWDECDLELDADDALQGAVRYNIFQLLCNDAAGDRTVSIGARGLTHGRYKGNTYWDTEIFLLPFYLWTRPEAAKNLLLYRKDRLDDARELALRQNLEGARFPWMCSDSGKEQCESWDIGLCETHITADVAYAMQRYVEITGDETFAHEDATEVWCETARYWLSRLTWEKDKNQYSSFFVKGPDEYCGATINNTYTNYLARNNIRLALRYGDLDDEEYAKLEHAQKHIAILYDAERGLFLQDELLNRLEDAPFLKQDGVPAYKRVCFDRMQRYRVLKQADLVLLMTLFPCDFTDEQKRNVFSCYEPITLHDSTLSYGVHAQLALTLELWNKAEEYLQKAIFLDLYDVLGNTGHEGVHMAALGAAWQALIFGAAGVALGKDGKVTAQPHLPPSIRAMRFTVKACGKRYRVSVSASGKAEVQQVTQ